MLEFLLSFLVVLSRKMDSINSTIMKCLFMSTLLSAYVSFGTELFKIGFKPTYIPL